MTPVEPGVNAEAFAAGLGLGIAATFIFWGLLVALSLLRRILSETV